MNDIGTLELRRQFDNFSKDSSLDIVLLNSNSDTDAVIHAKSRDEWQKLVARQALFFDEKIKVTIILRSSFPESGLRAILPSLELTASAHATNAVPDSSTTPAAAKYEVASHKFDGKYYISKVGSFTQVVWNEIIHLIRPNGRLQRPAVFFTALLVPTAAIQNAAKRYDQRFFQSYEAQPANVLDSLRLSDDARAYISEARIAKVAPPTGSADDQIRSLRGITKRAFPISPILFSRLSTADISTSTLLSLHIEASNQIDGDILINSITIDCQDASVAALRGETSQTLSAGDEIVKVFTLLPTEMRREQQTRTAAVKMTAVAKLYDGTEIDIDIAYRAQIDVFPVRMTASAMWKDDADTTSTIKYSLKDKVTFSLSAPQFVDLRSTYHIKVQCVNESARTRHFAIKAGHESVASMVLVIIPHVQLGPVEPGACFETSIQLQAVAAGIQQLGSLRIFDLDSKLFVDVIDLPDIIVSQSS